MNIKISPSVLKGDIDIIISKSYAHRLLICASLADKPTEIIGRSDAKDITATIKCLTALGAAIESTPSGYLVTPLTLTKGGVCEAGESGSTLRFMMPLACALGAECTFTGEGRLKERPLKDLLMSLRNGGAVINDAMPYNISGSLKSGEYKIRGDISSQYISGLLFALPLLTGDSKIIIEGKQASAGYIDITMETLKIFNIDIEITDYGYFIKGNQKYITSGKVTVEGDWSNAAFWLVLGAVNGDITVKGLNTNSLQGDKEILNILTKMGADIEINDKGIRVKRSDLHSIEIDADNIPDLAPVISVLASQAKGTTVITNTERLRLKESDRIKSTTQLLERMGIQTTYNGGMNITNGKLMGGEIDSFNDHRIVMSASVAASVAVGDTIITGIEATDKSYPLFFEEYKKLGGKFDVIG